MRQIKFPLICDTCGQTIVNMSDAMIEWINDDNGIWNVKVIHRCDVSPKYPHGDCYNNSKKDGFEDSHAERVLNDYELMKSLGLERKITVVTL